jgi:hypothetical protein
VLNLLSTGTTLHFTFKNNKYGTNGKAHTEERTTKAIYAAHISSRFKWNCDSDKQKERESHMFSATPYKVTV